MFDKYFAPCKGIGILESGKFLFVESKTPKNFARGIRNSRDLESRIEPKYSEIPLRNGIQKPHCTEKDWNPAPESAIYGMGSRIQDCLVFLNMGR